MKQLHSLHLSQQNTLLKSILWNMKDLSFMLINSKMEIQLIWEPSLISTDPQEMKTLGLHLSWSQSWVTSYMLSENCRNDHSLNFSLSFLGLQLDAFFWLDLQNASFRIKSTLKLRTENVQCFLEHGVIRKPKIDSQLT